MDILFNIVRDLPDIVVLVIGAGATAGIAVGLGWVGRRLIFSRSGDIPDEHAKLAELVHGSLLAFAVFVLALVLSDVRSNLGRADDSASREAATISRFDRTLEQLTVEAGRRMRVDLRAYVAAVTQQEWALLGSIEPALSQEAGKRLAALWTDLKQAEAQDPVNAAGLRGLLERMEDLRQGRLEAATKSIPRVFWWVILAFMAGAMVMNGRYRLNSTSFALIVTHMAGLGLVVALILVMDEPFRGQTSISPQGLAKSIQPLAQQ